MDKRPEMTREDAEKRCARAVELLNKISPQVSDNQAELFAREAIQVLSGVPGIPADLLRKTANLYI